MGIFPKSGIKLLALAGKFPYHWSHWEALFDEILNETISYLLFLIVKETIKFLEAQQNLCILILYPTNLPDSLMSSIRFLMASFRIFYV